jgi:hypothetical protein
VPLVDDQKGGGSCARTGIKPSPTLRGTESWAWPAGELCQAATLSLITAMQCNATPNPTLSPTPTLSKGAARSIVLAGRRAYRLADRWTLILTERAHVCIAVPTVLYVPISRAPRSTSGILLSTPPLLLVPLLLVAVLLLVLGTELLVPLLPWILSSLLPVVPLLLLARLLEMMTPVARNMTCITPRSATTATGMGALSKTYSILHGTRQSVLFWVQHMVEEPKSRDRKMVGARCEGCCACPSPEGRGI